VVVAICALAADNRARGVEKVVDARTLGGEIVMWACEVNDERTS